MSSMSISGMHRPDPSQMASKLFSKLDTKNQGYLEKSDLQSAFSQISSTGGSDTSTASVDDVFSQLDSNSDGKVTKDEFSSTLKKLADELDSQFNSMRMGGAGGMGSASGMGGMPPPPPPSGGEGGDDAGFTKDELTSQLKEIGSSDSQRSSLISKVVSNFDQADSDGDGKVSLKEAMAYDQSTRTSATSSASGDATGAAAADSASGTSTNNDAQVMMKIMQLMQAYGGFGQEQNSSGLSSLLSTSA